MSCRVTYNRISLVGVLAVKDVCLAGLDRVLKVTDVCLARVLTTESLL